MSISLLEDTQGIKGYQLIRNEYAGGFFTAYISRKPGYFFVLIATAVI